MESSYSTCPIGVDDSFGPWAGQECRGGFDFTLMFEEIILSIPLQCIFLLGLPVRVWQLAKSDRKVKTSVQRTLKAVSYPKIIPGFPPFLPADQPASAHASVSWLSTSLCLPSGAVIRPSRAVTPARPVPRWFWRSLPRWVSVSSPGSSMRGRSDHHLSFPHTSSSPFFSIWLALAR